MKKIRLIWVPVMVMMGLQFIYLCSCKEEDELPGGITTEKITKVTDHSACCCGAVIDEGSSEVWERGICWCCSENPTKTKMDGFSLYTKDSVSYQCALSGLSPNTTYYVRAFATNHEGTAYGNQISFTTAPTVTDIDGNVYHTVYIGDRLWMAENLEVTRYRNGDPIPEGENITVWGNLYTGAWIDLPAQFNKGYGLLYNFYAVSDVRNLAPEGWHVATDEEWKILSGTVDSRYLVGDPNWEDAGYHGYDAGGNLKSTTDQWTQPNNGATDKYGFSALPGGYMDWDNMGFLLNDEQAVFWTATPFNGSNAWYRALTYQGPGIYRNVASKQGGASIRCVKD